jgi:subtilisin family serine protease
MGRVCRVFGVVSALALIVLNVGAPNARSAPAADLPNDPGAPLQWGLAAIRAPEAWAIGRGAGITVAVVDTGIDVNQEDLQGRIAGAASCSNGTCVDDGGADDDGHGTHVAGIVAATAGNGIGIAGVAPDAKVLGIKVLHKPNGCSSCEVRGSAEDVAAAIDYAVARGAQVINLSLGGTIQSMLGTAFGSAIDRAWSAGVIAVVAAGNDAILGSGFNDEPALVVDALNRAGTKATYSNGVGGARWALAAPGGESDDSASCMTSPNGILSTYWNANNDTTGYACVAGTSMAAPHVAGAVAILRSAGLSPLQTIDRLLSSANDLGLPGHDTIYGSGSLDIAAAVDGVTSSETGAGVAATPTTAAVAVPAPTTAAPQPSVRSPSPTSTTTPPTTNQAPQVTLQRASGVQVGTGDSGDDSLPGAWVAVALTVTLGVGAAVSWHLIRGADWARRTPR